MNQLSEILGFDFKGVKHHVTALEKNF